MGLRVIGAGLGRTGTMSLKLALEQLGFGPCYHMSECMPRGPEHWQLWVDALNGQPDWDRIFSGFAATVDFPGASSYQALAAHYPQAKVILTVRDPERWFASTQETIFAPDWTSYLHSVPMGRFIQATVNDYLQDRMHDRTHLLARFEAHTREVKANIPPERLLVYEVKQGWAPLCRFLNVPIPETPFPRSNESAANRKMIEMIMQHGPDEVFRRLRQADEP